MGQDPATVAEARELHVPGSGARPVGRVGAGPRGPPGLVGPGSPAPSALASVCRHAGLGLGAYGAAHEGMQRLASGGAARSCSASRGLACQQPGGVRQQYGADATGATPEDDAGVTGPEAPVL